MKTTIKIWFLIFVFCLNYVSCKKDNSRIKSKAISEKDCIENILRLDDSLGDIRNHACEKKSLSLTIIQYSDAIKNLPFKNCPEDFVKAFKLHENAWRNIIALTDDYPELRGEMHDLFDQIELSKDSIEFKKLLKDIWDTWKPVESFNKTD